MEEGLPLIFVEIFVIESFMYFKESIGKRRYRKRELHIGLSVTSTCSVIHGLCYILYDSLACSI